VGGFCEHDTEISVSTVKRVFLGRFHPFYRPGRPLGRVGRVEV
jgi:hypothetical protein